MNFQVDSKFRRWFIQRKSSSSVKSVKGVAEVLTIRDIIEKAEIGRHSTGEDEWEVYKFLLEESPEFPASNPITKLLIRVKRTLMGW